jgi:hypothetical protein
MKLLYEKFNPDLPTVLCISSDQFNRDLYMLQLLGKRFNWVAISDKKLVDAQPWVPQRLRKQGYYVNEESPEADAVWARTRDFGVELLHTVKAQMPTLAAVMAGNWDYWNEECLRLACREVGLPFLVLMREHNLTPNRAEDEVLYREVKRIPQVDGVAVAGPATYDFIRDLGLQPPEIVKSTGFPRFDIWTVPTTPGFERPVILFSYYWGYGTGPHFTEMLGIFDKVARRHPDIPFLIKAKIHSEIPKIEKLIPEFSPNLKIVDALALPVLIKGARALVGFRSLTLYEGLLEGAPIFIPYWGDAALAPDLLAPGPGDPRLRGFMQFLSSPEAFEAALEDAIVNDRRDENLAARHALFAQYFEHHPHQRATFRVEKFVAQVLAARAEGRPPFPVAPAGDHAA